MAQAIHARQDGDIFQARIFWLNAACLLDPESDIVKVSFEVGPKSFDDVAVEYNQEKSRHDQYGNNLLKEHIQCKWHTSNGSYGYADLAESDFINANTYSLLQRAKQALDVADDRLGVRFRLMTNWRIDRNDGLNDIVNTRSGTINIEKLYSSKTDKSKYGLIRKLWREHLGCDENSLSEFCPALAFSSLSDSLDDLRIRLDALFSGVGLKRIPANETAFFYDQLPFRWAAQGRNEFDRNTFRKICSQERLLTGTSEPLPILFGIKSFEHPIDSLYSRCVDVLDFVPEFDGRFIRNAEDWSNKLFPELKSYLLNSAKKTEALRLVLDTHTSLAFASGSILNIKSGRRIEIEQRTLERKLWFCGDNTPDKNWSELCCNCEIIDQDGSDIAVSVSITHDIYPDVRSYIEKSGLNVACILQASLTGGAGSTAIKCGQHAFNLSEKLAQSIIKHRPDRKSRVHIFIAGPNSFSFFLGQRQPSLGRTVLYEYDFEGVESGTYAPSLEYKT